MATVFLLVGLPASGKTTEAHRLATEQRALRFTPDEWMIPLFGESDAGGRRDVLEGRLISLAVQAVRLGTSVVLDFGLWGRDERSALRWLFETEGAAVRSIYLSIDPARQLERIERRWAMRPEHTFPISAADLESWRADFEVPDGNELAGRGRPDLPPGWSSWLAWAVDRWPSLSTDPNPTATPAL